MPEMKDHSVQVLLVPYSPYCQSVVIALAEKGVPFSAIEEDLANKSQRLLEANPTHKKVPVLIHNGKAIAESSVILQYIDDAWPTSFLSHGGHSLFPDTPYESAQARFWADFITQKVSRPLHQMLKVRDSQLDKAAFEETFCQLNSAIIECAKDEKPFFFGKRLGIVDLTFAPLISWFSSYELFENLRIPSSTQAPRLHEWMTSLAQHPLIKPVLTAPESIEETVRAYRSRKPSIAAAGTVHG